MRPSGLVGDEGASQNPAGRLVLKQLAVLVAHATHRLNCLDLVRGVTVGNLSRLADPGGPKRNGGPRVKPPVTESSDVGKAHRLGSGSRAIRRMQTARRPERRTIVSRVTIEAYAVSDHTPGANADPGRTPPHNQEEIARDSDGLPTRHSSARFVVASRAGGRLIS